MTAYEHLNYHDARAAQVMLAYLLSDIRFWHSSEYQWVEQKLALVTWHLLTRDRLNQVWQRKAERDQEIADAILKEAYPLHVVRTQI